MYKILIVDDEPLVRKSIVKKLEWEALGFSDVYEAENGVEALEKALLYCPHLILTDIRMPFMDGLELSAKVKELLPSTYIVILSGHDEFKYAQDSIKLGILDYILKPLGAATLTKKIQEIKARIDEDFVNKQYIFKIKNQLHQSLPLLKESLLYSLVCKSSNVQEAENRLLSLDIPILKGPYMIALVEPDLSYINSVDTEVYFFAVKNIVIESFGENHPVFSDNSGRLAVIINMLSLPSGTDNKESILETLNILLKSINVYLKVPVTISLGSVTEHINKLPSSYKEALLALDCKYTLGKNKIYDITDLDYFKEEFLFPTDAINQFVSAVKTLRVSSINLKMDEICQLVKNSKSISASNIKLIFIKIITALLQLITETKSVSDAEWTNGLKLFDQIEKLGTVDEISKAVLSFAMDIANQLSEVRNNSSKNITVKAMEYVRDNYTLEELSLNTAAGHISVSSGYLCAIFKKEVGINFSEYVTKVRMEKAIEILRTTDLKTYEIAYAIGFSNPHYFSISFKKYTGLSPSEFRGEKED